MRLTIALAKGRLLPPSLDLLRRVGMVDDTLHPATRRLFFESPSGGSRIIIVRPTDLPTYVEYGAADMGIVGKDVLLEQGRELYEPLDLGFGRCRIVVAEPKGMVVRKEVSLRIATKYPNITERHFSTHGIPVEIIKLSGSIELAPFVGLADRIVDLSDSGETLRAHNLVVVEEIVQSTARLIVNRVSLKMKYQTIRETIKRFEEVVPRGSHQAD